MRTAVKEDFTVPPAYPIICMAAAKFNALPVHEVPAPTREVPIPEATVPGKGIWRSPRRHGGWLVGMMHLAPKGGHGAYEIVIDWYEPILSRPMVPADIGL